MPSLLQNKYVRFGLFGLGALVALIILAAILASLNSSRGSTSYFPNQGVSEPSYGGIDVAIDEDFAMETPSMGQAAFKNETSEYYPEPIPPVPGDGYTSSLERYETSQYRISARTKQFEEICDAVTNLKSEDAIHFKNFDSSINTCHAQFFVEKDRADGVVSLFKNFSGVKIDHSTNSVTRHKENIESQSSIVRQQLLSVTNTLTEAEVAFNEIVEFARQNKDAETLSEAIRAKLQQIDYLTQRKISLTSQLNNYAQQAADLNERIDVVRFAVNINRSNPVYPNKKSQQWENAWNELSEHFTSTLIGLTAMFGIFLLYVVQYGIYLLVLIVATRLGWKFVKIIWKY